ncbi:MAG: carbonic anhydrase [Alphaproteobacteria bacterium]|nr:carbonic anhydrase [Alphaproteobacteria bacterium]MDD9919071.1 carbonic anhydrase [Alphaproteobacteria bacterium]
MVSLPRILAEGYQRFRKNRFQQEESLFQELAQGQEPTVAVIACVDSRIYATEIFDAKPGDLFIIRNVAGLVPPYRGADEYRSTAAALEFAVCHLQVQHIVVLGHQHCGGIKAFTQPDMEHTEHISAWMHQLKDVAPTNDITLLEQAAIRKSVENLTSYPFIQEQIAQKKLTVHGAWIALPSIEIHWMKTVGFENINMQK